MPRIFKNLLHVVFWLSIPFQLAFIIWAFQFINFVPGGKGSGQSYWTIFSESIVLGTAIMITGACTFYIVKTAVTADLWKRPVRAGKIFLLLLALATLPALITVVISFASFAVAWSFYYFLLVSYCAMVAFSILGAFYGSVQRSINKSREIAALENRNIQSELQLLRSQIAPHFLFNTINNIDGMLLTDPPRASEYLNKLSTLLRFTLYESAEETILLSREIEFILKYLSLQKIRSTNPGFVQLQIKGVAESQRVAPMTFIAIVENAFKHVSAKTVDNAIQINIEICPGRLLFNCRNLFDAGPATKPLQSSGLGMRLINERLNLLYGDKHKVDITIRDQYYDVALMIML